MSNLKEINSQQKHAIRIIYNKKKVWNSTRITEINKEFKCISN